MNAALAGDVVWRLDDLYSGSDDPRIENAKKWCMEEAARFAKAYRGRMPSLEPYELLEAIQRYEALEELARKLISFAQLYFATQTQNPEASRLWQSMQEFSSMLQRDLLFFELEWTQLEDRFANEFLRSPELEPYRHYLRSLRRYKPHTLSEKEEQIITQMEPAGAASWGALFDKILSQLQFGESRRSESEVLSDLYRPERETRKKAAQELTDGLQGVLHILSHIFNSILLDKSIVDRLRKYPHWLRSMNLSNEADDKMVEALIQAVTSRYDLVQRYYRLKRRLLDYDKLYDYDRYAPVPGLPGKVFQWEEAMETVLSAYDDFSPRFGEIAREFYESGWIHAPVLQGKRSGAFAHPTVPSVHPYVLVNFTGTHRDIMTLAHELGHGVHQHLARQQGLFNSDTPLTTAESASVFGEMLVFRHLIEGIESPAQRLALLCSKLEDIFATIFRQVSMNRFEDAVHNERREKGELDQKRISHLWMWTQKGMFGDSVELLPHYGIWWSYIPHFLHTPGYVYAYAFGELLVLALYQQYRETGEAFVPLYLDFLEAGGKAKPSELLRPFGIDLDDPDFWSRGLALLEDLLKEAEELAAMSPASA